MADAAHNRGSGVLIAGKVTLMLAHLAGLVVLTLPFTWDYSPLEAMDEFFHGYFQDLVDLQTPVDLLPLVIMSLALPLFLAPLIVLSQARALIPMQWSRWELRMAHVASISSAVVVALPYLLYLWMVWTDALLFVMFVIALWTTLIAIVVPGRFLIQRIRPLLPIINHLLWLRAAYAAHTVALLALFAPDLESGAWLALGIALLYAAEMAIFLIFGRRLAPRLVVTLWLPRGEFERPGDGSVPCANCGYDLRGAVATGKCVCPECGTAA